MSQDRNHSHLSLVPLFVEAAVACLLFAAPAIAEPLPEAHANRLIHSASPYLLEHAQNPVDCMERGGDWEGEKRTQVDLPLHRLQHLLLVPCGRTDDLLKTRHRPP
jgi:hypothetical protein